MAVVRTNPQIEHEGSMQCNKADVPANLPMDVTDGTTMIVVEDFSALLFHQGHWYDGNGSAIK